MTLSPRPPESRGTRWRLWLGFGLAALIGAVYWRSVGFGFAGLDDNQYVTRNQPVLDGLSLQGIQWAFTTFYVGNYVPFTWLSLMADTSVFGSAAWSYRLTNLLLHAANACLVFRFFDAATRSRWRSLFVAVLFAVHPLHVESVVWITERKDVLSIFFGLLALNTFAAYVKRQRVAWLVLCWGFFVASLLAKQTLVTFPFLLLLLDYWPFERLTRWPGKAVLEKVPLFAASAVFSWVSYCAQSLNGATALISGLPLSDRLANAVASYGQYLLNIVWPVHLAIFYPYPHYGWGSLHVLISLAVLLVITALAIIWVKARPQLFVGWCWFLGTLVPMIGLVQVGRQGMADRYAYFPMIGIYVFCAWCVPRRMLYGLAPALVACCATLTFLQVGYWKDDDSLFGRSIAVQDNATIRGYYGGRLIAEGRLKDGMRQLNKAAELAPKDDFVRARLGAGLAAMGRNADAIREFKLAIAIRSDQPSYYARLAAVLAREGRQQEAAEYFARAVELMPELADAARQRTDDPQISVPPGPQ